MSQENLKAIAKVFEAFNQGGIEAVPIDLFDEEVVFNEPPEQPGATAFHGREAFKEGFGKWSATWESQRSEIERVIDSGESVVVLTREMLVGRDGVETTQRSGVVFTFNDGRIVRFDAYWDQDKALEAAGITE